MKIEPSDIIKLLDNLARDHGDPTCNALYFIAIRGDNILDVCHEAIRILAAEKHAYLKMATDSYMIKPPAITTGSAGAERLGIKRPPGEAGD